MKNLRFKAKPNKIYKDETTIFGKVICTHCGINTDLLHVELSHISEYKKIYSHETIICRECWENLPSLEDETEENEAV